jgi:SNF2 family DNA or RNA helicase
MTLPSSLRDNHSRGSVGEFLRSVIKPHAKLAIVSAYFTIYAYEALRAQLDQIDELRFLFGDPQFIRNLDPERTEQKQFQIEQDALQLQNQLTQKRIARDCAQWLQEKVQIRSVKSAGLLHGKLYHINNNEHHEAILGSSNFTVRGLGLSGSRNNFELNMLVNDRRDLADLRLWFDELWDSKHVTDVKAEVLNYLSQIYSDHYPEFIYFKTLFHLFEDYLDEQRRNDLLTQQSQITSTQIWNALFEFQRDGVKGAISRILKHNGCIIADSVGLGKTYEALAVIKYFELRNDKVLVLCPKKLRQNWVIYQASNNSSLNPFVEDRFSYTVLSHTDLSRERGTTGDIDLSQINWGNYDLVVIDESHHFRNNIKGRRDEEGNQIKRTRYERLMEDIIKSGVKTKVLLLSATPVNNDLSDLRNQLAFLTGGRDDALRESLGIANIKDVLVSAQRHFQEWMKTGSGQVSDLMNKLDTRFFTLLDGVTIARSRKHIERYYGATIEHLGGFPQRLKPLSLSPEIDLAGRLDSYDDLNDEIVKYKLSLYNPSSYVLPAYASNYAQSRVQNFSQSQREKYLIAMMKVNFLKRLESSVEAFELTMRRTLEKIEQLEAKIKNYMAQPQAQSSVSTDDQGFAEIDNEDDELREAQLVGRGLKFNLAHLDLQRWLKDLETDKQQINRLLLQAKQVTPERDGKLKALKELITRKVQNPTTTKHDQPNRKVLVFTAFADTAVYLYTMLHDWARQELGIHSALVCGTASLNRTTLGQSDFHDILTNFSPISKRRSQSAHMPQDEQIDLLIATDCISEGQNLQDCDLVINYDIHWNPVRIIQRFGRIDRIGSVNKTVQLVNFWPTPDLNKYINLRNRVEARMALVDLAATGEDNLLAEPTITDESLLGYRDKQLLRLQDEVLDLEDFNETISLTDFSLDDFRVDLSKFLSQHQERLRKEPIGLYAVVDHAWGQNEQIKPGVLFCLRYTGGSDEQQRINPLHPFYLVYVRDDGTVRFGFSNPKQTLEVFRALALGRTTPDQVLCDWFDKQTQNGAEMSHYSSLLQAALQDIEQRFGSRVVTHIQQSRSALLPVAPPPSSRSQEFELITWLVIH